MIYIKNKYYLNKFLLSKHILFNRYNYYYKLFFLFVNIGLISTPLLFHFFLFKDNYNIFFNIIINYLYFIKIKGYE